MSKFRFVLVGAGAALALAGAGVLANVGAISLTNSDSHGDAVASAARTTCPHGPNGVHGQCVSAIASSKSEQETDSATTDACKAADVNEDSTEKASSKNENASERAAKASKADEKAEDAKEKAAEHSEDTTEKAQAKACEAAQASNP
ncbi:MAG: hypothetical protein E6I73_16075 [Chloroflexi bacterium]|nr:MAG: hypothetical protein E6I73_16075 [Chloroflexota bacterium]